MVDIGFPAEGPCESARLRLPSARLGHRSVFVLLGVVAALVYALLASINLGSQGLYYDELHQATAAFAYVGEEEPMMVAMSVGGVPVLNMPYSGAIKSAIYGLYLKYCDAEFSVNSWRMVGILVTCVGIIAFAVLAGPGLGVAGTSLFLFLLITDMTVLLSTRHDWGPVAMALALRLVLLGVWIRCACDVRMRCPAWNTAVIGAVVGFSIFEKLSSAALLPAAFLIMLFDNDRRQSLRHWAAFVVGGVVGGAPLVFANVYSMFETGGLVSLQSPPDILERSLAGMVHYAYSILSLGSGYTVSGAILGAEAQNPAKPEGVVIAVVLLLLVACVVRFFKRDRRWGAVGCAMVLFGVTALAVYLLPKKTGVHHWVIVTPFQYVAVAMALPLVWRVRVVGLPDRVLRISLTGAVVVLGLLRMGTSASTTRSLADGAASQGWHPSLTEFASFVGERADEVVVIAADWGIATQVYCLGGGQRDLVFELFWDYGGPEAFEEILMLEGRDTIYLATRNPPVKAFTEVTTRIVRDMESLQGWREVNVESEIAELAAVGVRKWQRGGSGSN